MPYIYKNQRHSKYGTSATRPFTLHNDAGLHWVQLFLFFFRSSIVWWWKVTVAWCVSTTMIHNAYVSIGTLIFYFISNPKQFFLFLIWCYLLHRISYFGCSKHHVQFSLMLHVTIILVCFTLVVPSLTPSPASTHPPQHHQLPAAYTIIPAPPPYWKIHFLPVMTWRKNWV